MRMRWMAILVGVVMVVPGQVVAQTEWWDDPANPVIVSPGDPGAWDDADRKHTRRPFRSRSHSYVRLNCASQADVTASGIPDEDVSPFFVDLVVAMRGPRGRFSGANRYCGQSRQPAGRAG